MAGPIRGSITLGNVTRAALKKHEGMVCYNKVRETMPARGVVALFFAKNGKGLAVGGIVLPLLKEGSK